MHTLFSEGERALERGKELARYGRPACEKRPWFTCLEGKESSDQGLVYLNDAVQILSAVQASLAENATVGRALAEAHIQSWNFSAALQVLETFLLQRIGDQERLRETLMLAHIMSTRGARLRDAARAQAEILRQFREANATFAAMHFVEVPAVTAVMARENIQRLHDKAIQDLPPLSLRPPVATMKQVWSSLVRRKEKTLTVGYLSGKGFQRYSTTEALLGKFFIRKQMPWRGAEGRRMRSLCYAPLPDDGSAQREMMGQVCDLVQAHAMTSLQLAHRIQSDKVHVLIDLHGYTLGATSVCAQVMQQQSAPVQAHFHGQPLTTGSAHVHWYLSDKISSPPEYSGHYKESLSLLPTSYLTNSLAAADHTKHLWRPAHQNSVSRATYGFAEEDVILAYFGQTYKIDPAVLSVRVCFLRRECVLLL